MAKSVNSNSESVWASASSRGPVLPDLGEDTESIAGDILDAGPLLGTRFEPLPLHGLCLPVMQLVAMAYRLRDWMGV